MTQNNTKPRIAYLGIGLMGLPMTHRLLAKGYTVTVYDIAPAQIEQARAAGAHTAATAAAAVKDADLVLVNLPTPDAVEAVVFGANDTSGTDDTGDTSGTSGTSGAGGTSGTGGTGGAASAMRPPQLLIDFSTNKVKQGKQFAARLKRQSGCAWIDAPVSGGPPAAGAGALTIMCGADDAADIERIRPLMADVSQRFTHMGPMGSGLAAKMLNQLIVGSLHVVLAEAASMAEAAGLDAARLPECLAGGYADGPLFQRLYPRMVRRDFAPQGYVRQLKKDLEMVEAYAAEIDTPIPMLGQALTLYRQLADAGHAELDTAAVFKLYDERLI